MSIENAKKYLSKFDLDKKILEFNVSSATVKLAAEAIGVDEAKIAKSLTFYIEDEVIMIVCAGDMKIDNFKFKIQFKEKPKMLLFEEVEKLVGHNVGGVCPFGIKGNVKVYLDVSLERFDKIYPACGSSNSAIELSFDQLKNSCQNFSGLVDVCRLKQ